MAPGTPSDQDGVARDRVNRVKYSYKNVSGNNLLTYCRVFSRFGMARRIRT